MTLTETRKRFAYSSASRATINLLDALRAGVTPADIATAIVRETGNREAARGVAEQLRAVCGELAGLLGDVGPGKETGAPTEEFIAEMLQLSAEARKMGADTLSNHYSLAASWAKSGQWSAASQEAKAESGNLQSLLARARSASDKLNHYLSNR